MCGGFGVLELDVYFDVWWYLDLWWYLDSMCGGIRQMYSICGGNQWSICGTKKNSQVWICGTYENGPNDVDLWYFALSLYLDLWCCFDMWWSTWGAGYGYITVELWMPKCQ